MEYLELLKKQFNDRVSFKEKRKNILQLIAPFYHEDGDMYSIFLEPSSEDINKVRISDHGLTLMKLSYSFDIDTPNKERIFEKIINENKVNYDNGNLFIDINTDYLYPAILQFAQTISKTTNMRLYKRELVQSYFFELLSSFIDSSLIKYNPNKNYLPIPDREDLEVDYRFSAKPKDIYLFGVKDNSKARLVTISCLEFLRKEIPFRSIVVHEDFESLSKKDRKIITNVVDKQYTDLEDFETNAESYFAREIA